MNGRVSNNYATWVQRMAAILGSVMLVLGLIPTQAVAEARDELVGLFDVQSLEQVASSDAPQGALSDENPVVASSQADHDYQLAMTAEMYPDEEQMVEWTITMTLPERRLYDAAVTFHAPGADLDGDGVVESYDEYDWMYGVSMEGSRDDTDVEETDDGFELTFPVGLEPKDAKEPVTLTFYTFVNADWYEQGSASEQHTGSIELSVSGETIATEASIDITKDSEDCTHEHFHYEVVDTKQHMWCCDDECKLRRIEDHNIVQNSTTYSCVCGVEVVTVTFDLDGGTGSMDRVAKAKDYEYQLPDIDPSVVPPDGAIFQGWSVKVGNGRAQKIPAGQIVKLSANTTVKAIWNKGIPYMDANNELQTTTSYTMLDQDDSVLTYSWYVASGSIKMSADKGFTIPANKTVNIILCDGASIELGGIFVTYGGTLNIYGQGNKDGTITSLGGIGISNFGTLGIYGGVITGASEYGVYNEGTLTLGDVQITGNALYGVINNYTADTSNTGTIQIKDNPRIQHNGAQGSKGTGVYLGGNTSFEVVGRLGSDARISVYVDGDTVRTFTKGYGTHNGTTPPDTFFTSTSGWFKVDSELSNNEAVFFLAISYVDENGIEQRVDDYTTVEKAGSTLKSGWYVLAGNANKGKLDVQGDVKLVLCEGATLECKGVHVKSGNKLTIYGQVKGNQASGKLVSTASDHCAGIGGGKKEKGGQITICGGHVEAEGGKYGAGIGCGDEGKGTDGNITIYDGYVKAKGGSEGAGIGGGDERGFHANIYIKGGQVIANGGKLAAGIGGGDAGSVDYVEISGNADVYAKGGEQGAGIGGGEDYPGGHVKIIGSTCKVEAHGQDKAVAIGYGDSGKQLGTLDLVDIELQRVTNKDTPCAAADRKSSLQKKDAVLEPCPHDGRTYTITNDTHTIQCNHCEVTSQDVGTAPHTFNLVNRCTDCNAKRMRFTFNTGGGQGEMEDVVRTATIPYVLPQCTYTPPTGKSFAGWSINGTLYEVGKTYTPTVDEEVVTVTATYTSNLTYVDQNGGTEHVGEYTSILSTHEVTLGNGWYVVTGNVTVDSIAVVGNASLLLCDDAKLNVNANDAFSVAAGATISIYGQQNGSGEIKTTRANLGTNNGTVNIYGGKLNGPNCGIVNNGTLLLARGGSESFSQYAVCNKASGNLMLGNDFAFNHTAIPTCDIYLEGNTVVSVVDDLKPQKPILIRTDAEGVFTSGLKEHCPTLEDPSTIFKKSFGGLDDSDVYPELTANGEAEIVRLIKYIDENDKEHTCKSFDEVEGHDRVFNEGWYVVRGKVNFSEANGIHINGTVRFILTDQSELKVADGIYVAAQSNANFHVYCQAGKSGSLVANSARENQAAIGGYDDRAVGAITIHGGNITATGTSSSAAIGGGRNAAGGTVTILAGNVVATSKDKAAGIGGGGAGRRAGGTVTISGGCVTATGGSRAAAIGGGSGGAGGTVNIQGGKVIAQAGTEAPVGNPAQAIGHGSGSTIPGKLTLYHTAKVSNNGVLYEITTTDNRAAKCLEPQATIEPCEHTQSHATPTSDGSAHTISCLHCAVTLEGELPHTFDSNGICTVCGAKDLVTISFDPGAGSGTMDAAMVMRNQPYELPKVCLFTPPASGIRLAKWSVNGKEYAKGATITPTNDLTVTAIWNDLIWYVDENDQDANIGDYEVIDQSTTTLVSGWYVVKQNTTVDELTVIGKNVKLLICDDATLSVGSMSGLTISEGCGLEVYAQRRFHNGTLANAYPTPGLSDNVVTLYNYGTTSIYGGVLRGVANTIINRGQLAIGRCEVQGGTSSAITNRGTLEVLDGEICGSTLMPGIVNRAAGNVSIKGGVVSGAIAVFNRDTTSVVTISGGSVRGVSYIDERTHAKSNGYAVMNSGTVTISGGEVSGDNSLGYTVRNQGKIAITGGSITSDYIGILAVDGPVDVSGGAFDTRSHCIKMAGGTLKLSGNPSFRTIQHNFANVYLRDDDTIDITGKLLCDTPIGVYRNNMGAFTKGYAAHNPDATNPTRHFRTIEMGDKYTQVYPQCTKEGEAEFARYVDYVDENGGPHACRSFQMVSNAISNAGEKDLSVVLQDGWFLVDEEVASEKPLEVYGEVNLILADGSHLSTPGMYVLSMRNAKLHIWAQEGGTGTLTSNAEGNSLGLAGIGGYERYEAGPISIHGGRIEATGGQNAAGIGGGYECTGDTIQVLGGTVIAKGGDHAQAIGAGAISYGLSPKSLDLYEGAKVTRKDGTVALEAERKDACRESYAKVEPCDHKGCYGITATGHTLHCAYCPAIIEDEQPHTFDSKGVCICGRKDSVTITFNAGKGSGTMQDEEAIRGKNFFLPTCEFTPPQEGLGIYKWQYGDELYMEEDAITPTEDVNVVTALWNDFVPYIDADGNPAEVGIYTNLEDDKDSVMEDGWYVVKQDLTVDSLHVNGSAGLLLCDGATLTINHEDGLSVEGGNTLDIYGQAGGTGRIVCGSDSARAVVMRVDGQVNMYGGVVDAEPNIQTAVVVTGDFHMERGSIVNAKTYGVRNKGVMDVCDEAALYGNYYAIQQEGEFTLAGHPTFSKDGVGNARADIRLDEGSVINVDTELDTSKKIVISMRADAGVFTSGLQASNPNLTNPTTVFETHDEPKGPRWGISPLLTDTGEAEITDYVNYVDEHGTTYACNDYELLSDRVDRYNDGEQDARILEGGWFFVDGEITMDGAPLQVVGRVDLILADGAKLGTAGIDVSTKNDAELHIWAQKGGTGSLVSAGMADVKNDSYYAGIGSTSKDNCGTVVIHGGSVEAYGSRYGAGIGNSFFGTDGSIRILGGTVIAQGGAYEHATGPEHAQAIGTGGNSLYRGEFELYDGAKVTRKDGNVALASQRKAACYENYARIEPCDHADGYTATKTGHMIACMYCNARSGAEEPHVFDDDYRCTVCGYHISEPTQMTQQLILTGQIGLTLFYYLPQIEGVDYSNSYVEFQISGKSARTQEAKYDPQKKNGKGNLYGFTCYVTSIEMAQPITAVFHYGDGKTVKNEGYSVENYITSYEAKKDGFSKETTDLVHAVADYGHYAMPFLSATNKWTIGTDYAEMKTHFTEAKDYDRKAIEAALAQYPRTRNLEGTGIKTTTFRLRLDSGTGVEITLEPLTDVDLSDVVAIYKNESYAMQRSGGKWKVLIRDLFAQRLDDWIVVKKDGRDVVTLCALSYANAVFNDANAGTDAVASMCAFYKYYESAMAYIASTQQEG